MGCDPLSGFHGATFEKECRDARGPGRVATGFVRRQPSLTRPPLHHIENALTDQPPLSQPAMPIESAEEGQRRYIAAATAAFRKDYAPMAAVIRRALETARQAEG